MYEWWEGLSGILKVLYIIAIPSTLLLVVQTVMIVMGFGEHGVDANPSDTCKGYLAAILPFLRDCDIDKC